MLRELAADYGEKVVASGRVNTAVVELLVSPDGATWSFVVTYANGPTCIAASGKDWQQLAPPQGQPLRWIPAAHGDDWISHVYPGCCSVSGGDCFPITTSHWDFDGIGSYRLRWYGIERHIPEMEAKPSLDGVAYVCETPSHVITCFIVPKAGT